MAYLDIRQDFVDGVHEIFSTLFNNLAEEKDGCFLYLMSNQRDTNIYGERKYKSYQPAKRLVCKAVITPTYGEETFEEIKDQAEFTVPLKSLLMNGLSVTQEGLAEMRKGIIKFHDVYYFIDNILPKAFVEDVFLLYTFQCSEDIHKEYLVQHFIEEETEETSDLTFTEEQVADKFVDFSDEVFNLGVDELLEIEKLKEHYADEREFISEIVKQGMFTNSLGSLLNDNEIKTPDAVDKITKNGDESSAFPSYDE